MTKFNSEQQVLIDAPLDQKVVGIALAGSGKTTTILERTKRILTEYKTGNVLMISFTRMAANDIRKKLRRVISEDQLRRVQVGTFHSIIGKLIRNHAVAVGLEPSFSVIDENSTTTMYQSIVEADAVKIAAAEEWLVNETHPRLQKRDFNKIANAVSTLVNTAQPIEIETGEFSDDTKHRIQKIDSTSINKTNIDKIINMLHSTFIESLKVGRETNTVNYDHILFIGYLMSKAGMLDAYSKSLVHMIVDEYQDTNALQDAFVRAVGKNNLTIIGDVNQAIYGFRGGRYELMEQHADEGQVVNMTYNYRSYAPILDIANKLIAHNESGSKHRKPMRTLMETDEGFGGITFTEADTDHVESRWVLKKIEHLIKKGVKPQEIAILVRSRTAITSMNLELAKSNIKVNDTTKFADFMNSDVMIDTLNFVKIFTNPRDIYAFMAVLDRPKRGIGAKALETLRANAFNHKLGIIEYLLSEHVSELTPGLRSKVQTFVDVYTKVIQPNNTMTLSDTVDYLLRETGYLAWVDGLKNKKTHENNLSILSNLVSEFEEEYKREHASYSLYDIANAFTFEMSSSIRQTDNDGVVIATIHGSKGLEWEHVFVLGMEDPIFPGSMTIASKDKEDMESERRLAYVAYTRAKKSLTLCWSHNRIASQQENMKVSRFVTESELGRPLRLR